MTPDADQLTARAPLLRMVDIGKSYGAVPALAAANLSIVAGEVVGLIGANGAGKSTLVHVMAGAIRPDEGHLEMDGQPIHFARPIDALGAGVALDTQELNLIEQESVAENLAYGDMPARWGVIDRRGLHARARRLLDRVGLQEIDPRLGAGLLSPVEARLVSIARVLAREPRLLILDEPSAALPTDTAQHLGPLIREAADAGAAIVYVSHRFEEVREFCDRVIAMRDGRVQGQLRGAEISVGRMIEIVGGRPSELDSAPRPAALDTPVVIRATALTGRRVRGVDLQVHAGEIVGVGGLHGSGRSELLRLLAGAQAPTAGTLEVLDGRPLRSPRDAAQRGVGYLPEGRQLMIFGDLDVTANTTIAVLRAINRLLTKQARERSLVAEVASRVRLVGAPDAPVATLSGGNQQKVCLARWLVGDVPLLVLDEPTLGIDVAARAEVHDLLRELAGAGKTVIVASAEPEELVSLCDRVIVMVEGSIARELRAPFDADTVVAASYAA
jgi:ABC-type sugar transport system ATPase subunit